MGKRKKEFKTYFEEKSILSPERINELKGKGLLKWIQTVIFKTLCWYDNYVLKN